MIRSIPFPIFMFSADTVMNALSALCGISVIMQNDNKGTGMILAPDEFVETTQCKLHSDLFLTANG